MIDDSTAGISTPPFTENPQNKSKNKSQNRLQTRHQNRAENEPQVLTTSRPEPRQPVKVSIRLWVTGKKQKQIACKVIVKRI